ncbi:MAG: 2-phospho-L-lactate transferase [Microthrixaceae bacterium]|nr:2-phospho-L-lactate transferase [Microthrixaceae bacterium]MCO5318118.1 2-phospho-L-lactate transferase [Microthrixaceae bacterium]
MRGDDRTVTVIAGGVGAAKFLAGLVEVVDPERVTAVVNVADDTVVHGLHVSPDLDSCTYTLAAVNDTERGWGLRGETWSAMEVLQRHAAANSVVDSDAAGWFSLGDRDLGTHLYRTSRLGDGLPLSRVTAEIARGWGIGATLLPVTDDPLRTRLRTVDGRELAFQEYFVRERHDVDVAEVVVDGTRAAHPAPGVLEAIGDATVVLVAPSNPVVSIDPVLMVPGVREAVTSRRSSVAAISPIVGGAALKGPADRLMRNLGHDPSVAGIARWYSALAECLVIDLEDEAHAGAVEASGMACVVTDTIMRSVDVSADLASTALEAAGWSP